jgi:HK97 family phage prohead protease
MLFKDLPLDECEIKFANAQNPLSFEGYASVWGRIDAYNDTVLKGAFSQTLADRKRAPMMLYGHNPGRVPGKWVALTEDSSGLMVRGELTPGHSEAADIAASMKHGAVSGLSIGGYTRDAETRADGGRVIKSFDLIEVSIVSMPAEDEARVDAASIKSLVDDCETIRDYERLLRDVSGLSSKAAAIVVARLRDVVRREGASERAEETEAKAAELAELVRTVSFPTFKGF